MKKLLLVLAVAFSCNSVLFAQTHTEGELVRSAFKLEKKAVVGDYLQLNDSLSKIFWPIYDRYETERTAISDRQIKLLEMYANSYKGMDAATAEKIYKESASIQKAGVALREKYAGTVKKNVSSAAALNFYMVEDYIATVIKSELYDAIPAPIHK